MKKNPYIIITILLIVIFIIARFQSSKITNYFYDKNEIVAASVDDENVLTISERDSIRKLVFFVTDASDLVRVKGELSFKEFQIPNSRWRHGESYIFVLDPQGKMLVHPDPEMEGKDQINLKDINGKFIVKGLIGAATNNQGKAEGWYHYQWPVPDGILPRWKSSYVRLVKAPSGKSFIVGSGMYNDEMEREFVVDMVKEAVGELQKSQSNAFRLFHDMGSPYRVKDAYVFVIDNKGIDLVNPGFPSLEGRDLMNVKDTRGKFLIREMFKVVEAKGSGWVDYMWPKPGESISTIKSAYVSKFSFGDKFYLVGCGVYLADAPKATATSKKLTAPELMMLVRNASKEFEQIGEKAYPDFRIKGSKWLRDDTYFFVWNSEGERKFHAVDPSIEGQVVSGLKDPNGRPFGKMFMDVFKAPEGEAWVHYMYPEPGDIFPAWKSSFIKRVNFPSGKQFIIGCGIYNMEMDKAFIEDVVNRAANLVAEKGKDAFPLLRDKTGPFVFMDTYVFVDNPEGIELVNSSQPSLEGKNLLKLKDAKGKFVEREIIDAALKHGSAWVSYHWYRPGENMPSLKNSFVKKVKFANETYIVGAGLYQDEPISGLGKTQ